MLEVILKVLAVVAGLASAMCWLYGAKTISRDQELKRRNRNTVRKGIPLDLGGVEIMDGDISYDLIGTLRHQSYWNRAGAVFAATAITFQTTTLMMS